jgi:hypothetical protein
MAGSCHASGEKWTHVRKKEETAVVRGGRCWWCLPHQVGERAHQAGRRRLREGGGLGAGGAHVSW